MLEPLDTDAFCPLDRPLDALLSDEEVDVVEGLLDEDLPLAADAQSLFCPLNELAEGVAAAAFADEVALEPYPRFWRVEPEEPTGVAAVALPEDDAECECGR